MDYNTMQKDELIEHAAALAGMIHTGYALLERYRGKTYEELGSEAFRCVLELELSIANSVANRHKVCQVLRDKHNVYII